MLVRAGAGAGIALVGAAVLAGTELAAALATAVVATVAAEARAVAATVFTGAEAATLPATVVADPVDPAVAEARQVGHRRHGDPAVVQRRGRVAPRGGGLRVGVPERQVVADDLKLADQKAAMEKSAKVAAEQQALLSGPSGAGSTAKIMASSVVASPLNANADTATKKAAPELAVRLDAVDMAGGLILVDTDGVRHPVEGVTDIDLNFTPGELPTVRVEFKLTKGIKFL